MEFLGTFVQQLANGIVLGSVYALIAIGLTLIFGVLGLVNLAQGEFFMVGAYAGLLVLSHGLGVPAALLAGVLAAVAVGLLTEQLALRPLPHGIDPHIPMVATIGVSIVLQQIASKLFTTRALPYPTPPLLAERVGLGPVRVEYLDLLILALVVALMTALTLFLKRSKLGIAIRAVAENGRAASLVGINRHFVILAVFAISSALAGIGGVLVGMYFNNVNPYVGFPLALKGLAAVIIGGLGSAVGAVVAGLMIGIVEVLAVGYVSSSWRDAIAFGVMIIILLVRPAGLFGRPSAEKV